MTQDDEDPPQRKDQFYNPNLFTWCQYPPATKKRLPLSSMLTNDEFSNLFSKAPEVKKYLPTPLQHILPSTSHHLHGDMTSTRRYDHTYNTYMSDGELELMLAIILGDGRYEESISIVPLTYVPQIRDAAKAYEKYEVACCKLKSVQDQRARGRYLIKSGYDEYDSETDKLVAAAQDASLTLAHEYADKQRHVVERVLMRDQSMRSEERRVGKEC